LLLCVGAAGNLGTTGALAQQEATASGFVSGFNRIMVHQTENAGDGADYGLAASTGTDWVVSILDITNFGTAAQAISLGDFFLVSAEGRDPVPAALSQEPSATFGFADVQPDASATVLVDSTIRVAVAFAVPSADTSASFTPALAFGDEQATVVGTLVDKLDLARLPAVQPWVGAQGAVVSVPGDGALEVNVGGAAQTVTLAGITTPPADGCFGAESSAAVTTLSGGSVWVEDDPSSDGSLVWYWDGGQGHLGLLNEALVEQGLAGFDSGYAGTAYAGWLSAKSSTATEAGTGLWEMCRDVEGEWINPPTPAPVPTKTADEVRADYTWVDTRDLVIRPNEFQGEQIAVQGSVFNIGVDEDGFTTMQIWLDGGSEAAVIGYDGDTRGIYEGTWVTVYGEGYGTFEGTNAFGGTISQPLIFADIVDF
jgi:endonuclease YncB( thermonuclease family)